MAKQDKPYICARFTGSDGKPPATTTEIAAELGVSYQAVHRILKAAGLSRKDGGKAAQVAARATAIVTNVEPVTGDTKVKPTSMCERYGCTKDQWEELRAMDEDYKKTPLAQYHTFKNNFQNLYPDAVFELTLWEWWTFWKESGLWGRHKRNPEGMYIIAQIDKALPFNKGNTRIIPFAQLLRETRANPVRKPKVQEK